MPTQKKRFISGPTLRLIQCNTCINYRPLSNTCRAYPKKIPREIFSGLVNHVLPYRGDNNIQYQQGQ